MLRKTYVLIISLIASCVCFSQGIINNGGSIVISGAANIYIDGGTAGGYLSQANGIIVPSASSRIFMEGDWTNNAGNTGFSSDNGAVVMLGANQSINGSSSTTFNDLTLQGTGVKTQNVATSVGGVSTTNGVLSVGNVIYDLNSFVLTITNGAAGGISVGTGYILSETNAATNPSIIRWNMGTSTGAHVFPFGVGTLQIPVTINKTSAGASNIDVSTRSTAASNNLPWAGASNVGGVSFFNCPNNGMTGNNCAINSVLDRWWDITPSAALTANVTLSYRGLENTLTSPYDTGLLGIQWWDGSGWALDNSVSGSAVGVTSGVGNVTASGLSQFCPFVISSAVIPLPVELVQMDLQCSDNGNLLTWTTASESNSQYFSIEKSSNAEDFVEIAQVKAAGNSKQTLNYAYTDELSDNVIGVSYYRIKEVDRNGTIKKFKLLSTGDCHKKHNAITISNTTEGKVFVTFNSSVETEYTISIYSLLGSLLKEEKISRAKGLSKIQLDTDGVLQSIYLLKVSGNGLTKNQKVAIAP